MVNWSRKERVERRGGGIKVTSKGKKKKISFWALIDLENQVYLAP